MATKAVKPVLVHLDIGLFEKMEDARYSMRVTRSEFVRLAIENEIDKIATSAPNGCLTGKEAS